MPSRSSTSISRPWPFRASGKKEKIASWYAGEWTSTGEGLAGMKTALWLADRPGGLPIDALTRVQRAVFSRDGSQWEPYLDAMEKFPGFSVRTVLTWKEGGRDATVTLTVTRIRAAKIEKSEITVPDGWRQVDDPFGILPSSGATAP